MSKHTPGPWRDQHFDTYTHVIRGPNDYYVCATPAYSGEVAAANARLIAAAPELLEVARIEQTLQMGGYTKATAKKLGPDAEDAHIRGGAPGLNNWRREKREAAIAKAEGACTT